MLDGITAAAPRRASPGAGAGHFDDTHGRDKALYLTWLASSYVQAREVEQAAATLGRAHELCAGVASVRPLARIAVVPRKLKPHRGRREVAEVLDRIAVSPVAVADSTHAK